MSDKPIHASPIVRAYTIKWDEFLMYRHPQTAHFSETLCAYSAEDAYFQWSVFSKQRDTAASRRDCRSERITALGPAEQNDDDKAGD